MMLIATPHLARVGKADQDPPPCAANHVNVEGYDANKPPSYGNEGSIYVLTQSTLNGINDNIYRSLFVRGPGGSSGNSFYNDVEVDWTAGNGMFSNTPVVYSEWVIDGQDSGQQNYTGYTLNPNTNYHFKVENVGGDRIFRFVVDGQSSPFNYSPQVNFNEGYDITNSEHHNNCDTLYANFTNLQWSPSYGTWSTSGYQDYECFADNSTDWYFHKNSNTSSDVTQNFGVC
ncbi:MAG: hypothetical protein ACRDPO_31065 [Streptosporangiaceae bacterium]